MRGETFSTIATEGGSYGYLHDMYYKNITLESPEASVQNFRFWGNGWDASGNGRVSDIYISEVHFADYGIGNQYNEPGSRASGDVSNVHFNNFHVGGELQTNTTQAKFHFGSGPVSSDDFVFTDNAPTIVGIIASTLYGNTSGTNPARFTVFRTGGSNDNVLTLNYTIRGTARNGEDYEDIGTSVTIPSGQDSAHILIQPLASYSGGLKTVLLSLDNLDLSTGWMLGPWYHAQAVITDPGDNSTGKNPATATTCNRKKSEISPRYFLLNGAHFSQASHDARTRGEYRLVILVSDLKSQKKCRLSVVPLH